jgi:ATP-dependent Lon protease
MEGTGKIELTGSLGDVMKESARLAVSYIRAHADELGVAPDFYKTKDIHIHVPEGATPKDGPSAGVSILTSLTSALSGRPVHRDIAMTGELTLTGRVLAIGGLKEKTTAAWSAGVTRVIIPYDNRADLEEIDPLVRQKLLFIPCRDAGEVLRAAIRFEETGAPRSESQAEQDTTDPFATLIPAGDARIPVAIR